ncbi:MAG: L,D-transpeptidase family protein [Bacteroidota bacterium]
MKRNLPFIIFCLLILFACKDEKKAGPKITPRDKGITVANSYSDLFFDSTKMESFISKEAITDSLADHIRSFYNSRNYQFAWFDSAGIAEYVRSFLNLQDQYIMYAKDSSLYNPLLQQLADSIMTDSSAYKIVNDDKLKTELLLTESFFRYAAKAYQGNTSINTKDLDWFIPRKKVDVAGVLDSMLANKTKDLSAYEPVNRQYNLLKNYLLKYYEVEKQGGWGIINGDKKSYSMGDNSTVISQIKKRLLVTADMIDNDTSSIFNESLKTGVKNFQHRYGLKEDGVVNKSLIAELNRPVNERIGQLLINMERIRWVPAEPASNFLLVNIPAYKLFVYEDGRLSWNMNVVVGAVAHSTVIFSGDMKYIVFSPYWNVPASIIKKEVMPGIKKNPNYLASHKMEWNNGAVRQLPGPQNSLGQVKFLFPNSYSIYLHDTPSKNLFNENKRAFSHGCIRLAEPKKLAEYLLRKDSAWTTERITKAMNAAKEQYVTLKQTIPVFIGYFTAWVDRDGKLNFRDDIYGHDKKMAAQLFAVKK